MCTFGVDVFVLQPPVSLSELEIGINQWAAPPEEAGIYKRMKKRRKRERKYARNHAKNREKERERKKEHDVWLITFFYLISPLASYSLLFFLIGRVVSCDLFLLSSFIL